MKVLNAGFAHTSDRKRVELDALARRLRGIMKSISRYPTYRRRFIDSMKTLTEDLSKKNRETVPTESVEESVKPAPFLRSKSAFACFFGPSFSRTRGGSGHHNETQVGADTDLDDIV